MSVTFPTRTALSYAPGATEYERETGGRPPPWTTGRDATTGTIVTSAAMTSAQVRQRQAFDMFPAPMEARGYQSFGSHSDNLGFAKFESLRSQRTCMTALFGLNRRLADAGSGRNFRAWAGRGACATTSAGTRTTTP